MVDGELQLAIRGGSIQAPASSRRRRVTGRTAAPAGDGDEAGGGGAAREGPAGEPLYVYPGEKGRRAGADGRVQLYFANPTERTVWRIALERAVKVRFSTCLAVTAMVATDEEVSPRFLPVLSVVVPSFRSHTC